MVASIQEHCWSILDKKDIKSLDLMQFPIVEIITAIHTI